MKRTKTMPWNEYAQTYPLIVFCSCIFLFFVQISRQNWIHLVPITLLGISSGLTFFFWTLRLRGIEKKRRFLLLAVGYIAQIIGVSGFVLLLTLLAIVLFVPHLLGRFNITPSVVFWLMWGFTLVELAHNHIYKLTCGRYTMERILVERCWSKIAEPFGGSIGQQIHKIRRNYGLSTDRSKKA